MTSGQASVVGLDRGDRVVLWVGGPLVGLGIGWALPYVADWADRQPWVPFGGPLHLIASWGGSWVALTLLTAGVLAGLAFAANAIWETTEITVTGTEVRLTAKGHTDTIAAGDLAGAFVDGKRLVLLGKDGGELARRPHESKPAELAAAFTTHGHPWFDADPHAEEFLRWVPDSPGVSPAANALLAARATALEKKRADDAEDLRTELAKLGYVVRDEMTRQYWRALPDG